MSRDDSLRGGKSPKPTRKRPSQASARSKPAPKPALALATKATYQYAWERYQRWAVETGNTADLPVPMTIIGDYILDLNPKITDETLATLVAGIRHAHRSSGHYWPKRSPVLDAVRRRFREGYNDSDMARHLAACTTDLAGIRDWAIVSLRLGAGLSAEQLSLINRDDVAFSRRHLDLQLRGYHGNPDEILRLVHQTNDLLRPASALESWLNAARIRKGPAFPIILSSNQLGHGLSYSTLRNTITAVASRAGYTRPGRRS